MPTVKPRINITISEEMIALLKALAEQNQVPMATQAKELLEQSLEMHEDDIWNKKAEERDTKDAKYLSHEEVWS